MNSCSPLCPRLATSPSRDLHYAIHGRAAKHSFGACTGSRYFAPMLIVPTGRGDFGFGKVNNPSRIAAFVGALLTDEPKGTWVNRPQAVRCFAHFVISAGNRIQARGLRRSALRPAVTWLLENTIGSDGAHPLIDFA